MKYSSWSVRELAQLKMNPQVLAQRLQKDRDAIHWDAEDWMGQVLVGTHQKSQHMVTSIVGYQIPCT